MLTRRFAPALCHQRKKLRCTTSDNTLLFSRKQLVDLEIGSRMFIWTASYMETCNKTKTRDTLRVILACIHLPESSRRTRVHALTRGLLQKLISVGENAAMIHVSLTWRRSATHSYSSDCSCYAKSPRRSGGRDCSASGTSARSSIMRTIPRSSS